MDDIIKKTSVCRIHEGRPVQFPFFRIFGGVTLTKGHLIIIQIVRTQYYLTLLLAGVCLCTILNISSTSIGMTASLLILLPLMIVVVPPVRNRLLLRNVRKQMGDMGTIEDTEDCLMIPLHSIKKVDTRRVASWNYIRISYEVGRGLCNDASFVVLSRWGLTLKKTQMAWACAIKEAITAEIGMK